MADKAVQIGVVKLLLMTERSLPSGENEIFAALVRNGRPVNLKGKTDEFPGCCQLTLCGPVLETDTENSGTFHQAFRKALLREMNKKLGGYVANIVETINLAQLIYLPKKEGVTEEILILGGFVTEDTLAMVQFGYHCGGLDLLSQSQVGDIAHITESMRKIGPEFSHTRALSFVDRRAVEIAFEIDWPKNKE